MMLLIYPPAKYSSFLRYFFSQCEVAAKLTPAGAKLTNTPILSIDKYTYTLSVWKRRYSDIVCEVEVAIQAKQCSFKAVRYLNIGTRRGGTRVIEVSAGLFLYRCRKKGFSPSAARYRARHGRSFRERLFEQDLLTRLKLSRPPRLPPRSPPPPTHTHSTSSL